MTKLKVNLPVAAGDHLQEPRRGLRYGANAAQGPVLTLPAAFLSGRSSAIGYAVITGVGVLGGFIGPAFMGWARDFTGSYQSGLLLLAAPSAMAAGLIYLLSQRRDARAV